MTQKWWVLISVACGTFMATLDASIVNIALPTLTKDLGQDLNQVKWVVVIYLMVITCLLLPFGRLSDQWGRKPVFQIGFITFIIGSGLCGLVNSLASLVLFRGLQAVGASMLMANGPAIIASVFSPRERGAALGTLAMVVSTGLIAGPSLGGLLISTLGWRSIFWVNIPIGIIGFLMVHQFVLKEHHVRTPRPFDWAGALLQMLFLVLFIILFDPPQISVSGSLPIPISRWMAIVIVFVVAVLFIKVETEVDAPLFDLSLLGNRTFWTANLSGFFTFVALSSVTVMMPFYLEEVLHLPTQQASFFMTAIPLTIFVVAPVSGRLSDRFGSQELSFAGALVGGAGLLYMAGFVGPGLGAHSPSSTIIICLCAIGLAMGLFQSPNNSAIMGSVPVHKLSVASAMLATVRNLGMVAGTGLATSLFTWKMTHSGNFLLSFHTALFAAAIAALAAAVISLAKRRGPHWVGKIE